MRCTKAILIAAILLPMSAQCRADEGGNITAAPLPPAAPAAPAPAPAASDTAPAPRRAKSVEGGGGGGFGASGGGWGGQVSVNTTGDGRVEVSSPGGFAWASTELRVDRPYIITTQAIDQAQCREDLNIMEKLVRDRIVEVTGDVNPKAMGIKIMLLDSPAPMYIEGCGAVIAATVRMPLQAAKDAAGSKDEKTGTGSSAWQRAKAEIDAGPRANGKMFSKGVAPAPTVKAEDLIDAMVTILPEAANMHSLKPDENVIVTISGISDTGGSVRLTLRAKKSDIDDAASGKMTAEEFKQHVAHRVG